MLLRPAVRVGILGLGLVAAIAACARGVDDGDAIVTTASSPASASDAGSERPPTVAAPAPTTTPEDVDASSGAGAPDALADAAPPPPPPPPPPPFAVTTESLTVSGTARSYVLVVPTSYDAAKAYPLVLALHGDGGNGASLQAALHFEDASGPNAIVAYPTGTGASWDLYTAASQDADVAFLEQLVAALRAKLHIGDAFAIGMSSGAFMANQMACRRPALFRGIVSHSGGTPAEPNDAHSSWGGDFVRCTGQDTGVAAMVIHGTADTTVPYPSGEHDANYWATVNGCASGYAASTPSPCEKRNGCPADKPVVFCPVDGLGHALWSQASSAAWSFISTL